jgi:helix-turn-helix protein
MQAGHTDLHQVEDGPRHGSVDIAPFFTVEELVARWFTETTANTDKTNRDNVRELISSGLIPGRKIGRRWYVHLKAVETYENGRDDPAVMRHSDNRRSAKDQRASVGGGEVR